MLIKLGPRLVWLKSLLFLGLMLAACGDNSPTALPATVAPTASPTASLAPTSVATATPVVLANLPPATLGQTTRAPLPTLGVAPSLRPTTASATPAAGTALPTYSPATVAAFSLKSGSSQGLDQKTVQRLTNLAGLPTLQEQPGVLQGGLIAASTWKIAPPLVWCEDTADHLNTVWAAFSFTMQLDDQPVDLKAYQTIDFSEDGAICRAIDLVLGAMPPGQHRVSVTRRLATEVESGLLGTKLAPGEYTYQLTIVSFAPDPNAAQTAKLSDFKPGTSQGVNATYPKPGQSFSFYSDVQEQYKPGTFKYTAVLPAGLPYAVLGGWCAKDQPTLDDNWKKMTYSVSLNGQAVDLKSVPQYDERRTSQVCRLWDLNMTPPEGQHKISIKINFNADTNDGTGTYQAGDYISEYTVLSLKLGTNP